MGEKDKEFIEWNKLNIMANLLQAEDHLALITSRESLPSEHGACVIKHLSNVYGELMEASKHCNIAEPNNCDVYKTIAKEVGKLVLKFKREGFNDKSVHEVRKIRKEFEQVAGVDTNKCGLGGCQLNSFNKEDKLLAYFVIAEVLENPELYGFDKTIIHDFKKRVSDKQLDEMANELQKDLDKNGITSVDEALKDPIIKAEIYDLMYKDGNIKDLVGVLWAKYRHLPFSERLEKVWEDIHRPYDASTIEEMIREGIKLKPNPICVIAKEVKGKDKKEASEQCIMEGKVNPLQVYWFKRKHGEE